MKPNRSHSPRPNRRLGQASKFTNTAHNPWLYGTIRKVERSGDLLFVHLPADQEDKIVRWLPQTRFLDQGAEVKSDALRDGQQIFVQYAHAGGEKVATEIDIVVKPASIESIAALRQSLWPFRADKRMRK